MLASRALVAAPIVARDACHEQLRVPALDLVEELRRRKATEPGRDLSMVQHRHNALALAILEAFRCTAHGPSLEPVMSTPEVFSPHFPRVTPGGNTLASLPPRMGDETTSTPEDFE